MKVWNDFTKEWSECPTTTTLQSLRSPGAYYIVSDAQLARDLRGRTVKDIYRENAAGRRPDLRVGPATVDKSAYLQWCQQRGHTPHPASIDPDHPIAKQREGLRYVARN